MSDSQIQETRRAARAGDPQAQLELGRWYDRLGGEPLYALAASFHDGWPNIFPIVEYRWGQTLTDIKRNLVELAEHPDALIKTNHFGFDVWVMSGEYVERFTAARQRLSGVLSHGQGRGTYWHVVSDDDPRDRRRYLSAVEESTCFYVLPRTLVIPVAKIIDELGSIYEDAETRDGFAVRTEGSEHQLREVGSWNAVLRHLAIDVVGPHHQQG